MNFLKEIRKLQPGMQLFVTLCHIPSIELEFEKAARVGIRAGNEDVGRYLEGRIENAPRLVGHVRSDPALKEEIIKTNVEKAEGM